VIESIVGWSGRHRVAVVVTTLVLAVAGVLTGARVRFDALPDITTNQVLVLTRAPGFTPEEVERLVTRRIEVALGGMPGLDAHRSTSRYGISAVTAVFADDVEPYRARQLVKERLDAVAADLPAGVDVPELGPLTGGLGEIFHFTVRSPRRTQVELFELVELRVAPLLRSVPGVVEVNTWGGARRTLDVVADPVRMARHGVTLEALHLAVTQSTGNAPGAAVPSGPAQTLLRGVAWPRTPAELGGSLVRVVPGGAPVHVADVADIVESTATRLGTATADGRGETVYVMVQMLRGENALRVLEGVHAHMEEVRAALPEDVQVDLVYDRGTLVRATLLTVFKNLLEGGVLVVLVLFATLGSFRAGLIVAMTIPLSMIGAVAGMVLLGEPGNLMSLGAIDFGLLVDGGVVVVEAVFHTLHHEALPADPLEARAHFRDRVIEVARSVARPVFYSVLIVALVYVPVLSLTGVDGKMFRPMAITVVLALATSLLLSLVFIPAATAMFLRPRDVPQREPLLIRSATRLYAPLLAAVTRVPALVAVASVALLALGVWLFSRTGSELVPQLDEGDLIVQTTRAPDVRLETGAEEATRLEAAVLAHVPEVYSVVSRIGSPAVATDIMGYEQADVFVGLRPRAEWREGLSKEALIAEIDAVISRHAPGAALSFTQPIQMRFNELLGGSVSDVAIGIEGEHLGELQRLAEAVAAQVRGVAGATDVRISAPPAVSLVEVRPRALDAAAMGLSTREVLDVVRALRVGLDAGRTYDGPIAVPVRVRLGDGASAYTVGDVSVPIVALAHPDGSGASGSASAGAAEPAGGLVPLSRIADLVDTQTPSLVEHRNGQRRIVVGFNVRGADLGTVVAEARARVAAHVVRPRGYALRWGGQIESLEEARARLAVVIPVVLVTILALLIWLFRAWRPAAIIFLNVPFAAVGGTVALTLRGMPVSISAAIGFIALSGIAVLNGVVLISRVRTLEQEGHDAGSAVREAARGRMRPVLMTALVAALGFVPMMVATGVGAEVQRPLASVVVGGLVTSTLLTLVVLPALYPWLAARRRPPAEIAAPPTIVGGAS